MADVFLSYDHADRRKAQELAKTLTASGWTVFWDRAIHAGPRFRDVIARELESAKCVVVLWSPASVQSDWVIDEAEEAKTSGRLVPAFLEAAKLPHGFRGLQTANLDSWTSGTADAEFDLFIAGIKAHAPRATGITPLEATKPIRASGEMQKGRVAESPPIPADPKGSPSPAWEGIMHWVDANVTPVYQAQNESEELIEKLTAVLRRGIVLVGGRMFLTNQRVLFEPTNVNSFLLVIFALRGARSRDRAAARLRWTPVSIPLSAIERVVPSRYLGIFPVQITIRCHSGEKYRFEVWGRKQIVAKIETCRKRSQTVS